MSGASVFGSPWRRAILGAGITLGVAACAGDPAPDAEMARADLAVSQAEDANAGTHAPGPYALAQDKLERARAAVGDGDNLAARRLAEQAAADAQLAEAQARSEVARQNAAELRANIGTLRDELDPRAPDFLTAEGSEDHAKPLSAGVITRRGVLLRLAVVGMAALVAACAGRSSASLQEARSAVATARGDQEVLARAPEELLESERALDRAESAFRGGADQDEIDHLAYLARQRAVTAQALAEERVALTEMEGLNEQLEDELAGLPARQTDRGLVVTLGEDILFDTDRADIKAGGAQELARIADFLRNHPDRNLLVEGHTDSTASDTYNLALSQRRANAVEDFLISLGVDPTRIDGRGYGEQLPVATNDSAAGRQQNRRVELVILDPGEAMPGPRVAIQ